MIYRGLTAYECQLSLNLTEKCKQEKTNGVHDKCIYLKFQFATNTNKDQLFHTIAND